MHLAGRAAGDREILAGEVDGLAVDLGAAGDHAVRRQFPVAEPEGGALVLGEQADFLEAALVGQLGHAFAGGQLAAGMLLFDLGDAAAQLQAGAPGVQLVEPLVDSLGCRMGAVLGHRWSLPNSSRDQISGLRQAPGATVTLCSLPCRVMT